MRKISKAKWSSIESLEKLSNINDLSADESLEKLSNINDLSADESLEKLSNINDLSADFLGSCLRTSSGSISLWKIDNTDDELDKAIVAICAEGNQFSKVDVILLSEKELSTTEGLLSKKPEGITEFKDSHFELSNLNYRKIGKLAEIVFANINNQDRCRRVMEADVRKLFKKKIDGNKLKLPPNHILLEKLNYIKGDYCNKCGKRLE
ncbi:MAG: hypothetical protein FWE37_05620 [Spirochaetaceae bacterium]|nr:hypothetical protein [Spirochaetaceae bacterium]